MAHLNIPLYRNTQTTRSTRVVWLSGIVAWAAISLLGASAWLGRAATLQSVPEHASFALHFVPKQATWEQLERAFGGFSLVSGRSFFLGDLKALQPREFTLFIADDGSRTLAVRLKNGQDTTNFDTNGIVNQKVDRNVYLLSQTLTPTRATEVGWFHPLRSAINLLFSNRGTVRVFGSDPASGTIVLFEKKLIISLNKALFYGTAVRPETTTIAQTTFSAGKTADRPDFLEAFRPILGKTLMPTLEAFAKNIQTGGKISLYKADNSLHFRFSLPKNPEKPQDMNNLLRLWAAFRHPSRSEITLLDGTEVEEIRADVASVTLESVVVSGHPALRATDPEEGVSLTAYETESEVVVTDDLEDRTEAARETDCGKRPSHLYVDLSQIRNTPGNFSSYVTKPVWTLAGAFEELSIASKGKNTKITLCF